MGSGVTQCFWRTLAGVIGKACLAAVTAAEMFCTRGVAHSATCSSVQVRSVFGAATISLRQVWMVASFRADALGQALGPCTHATTLQVLEEPTTSSKLVWICRLCDPTPQGAFYGAVLLQLQALPFVAPVTPLPGRCMRRLIKVFVSAGPSSRFAHAAVAAPEKVTREHCRPPLAATIATRWSDAHAPSPVGGGQLTCWHGQPRQL